MRLINLRELRFSLGKELRSLPVAVIKRGKKIAIIVDPDWYDGAEIICDEYSHNILGDSDEAA